MRFRSRTSLKGALFFGLMALVCTHCLYAATPTATLSAANSPSPALENLDRLFQWGLHDSLLIGANLIIQDLEKSKTAENQSAGNRNKNTISTSPANFRARPYLYRGVARFALHDSVGAIADFRSAACLDSTLRLDSLYVPQLMLNRYNALRIDIGKGLETCSTPLDAQLYPVSIQQKNQDALSTENPSSKNSASHSSSWQNAAWGLGTLSLSAFAWGGYEAFAANSAYRDAEKAAQSQDASGLENFNLRYRESNQRKRLGLSLGALSALGSAFCFYKANQAKSRFTTNSIWVPQFLSATSHELKAAWVF